MVKRNTKNELSMLIIEVLLLLAVFVTVFTSFRTLDNDSAKQGVRQLEASVRRSALACYAAEGVYPPNVEYLEEHYGLQINNEKYIVRYSIFAENLMPDITVIDKHG